MKTDDPTLAAMMSVEIHVCENNEPAFLAEPGSLLVSPAWNTQPVSPQEQYLQPPLQYPQPPLEYPQQPLPYPQPPLQYAQPQLQYPQQAVHYQQQYPQPPVAYPYQSQCPAPSVTPVFLSQDGGQYMSQAGIPYPFPIVRPPPSRVAHVEVDDADFIPKVDAE